jgi:hypothetical protein
VGLITSETASALMGRASSRRDRPAPPPPPPRERTLDSPWRSRFYVTRRHSADGYDHRPGDPIPADEALRQGVIEAMPAELPSDLCSYCRGTGKRSWKISAKHRAGCLCVACKPCTHCEGTGKAA